LPLTAQCGELFASGRTLWFAAWKADLDARRKLHMEHKNFLARYICMYDCACQDFAPLHFADLRRTSEWRQTLMSAEVILSDPECRAPYRNLPGWNPFLNRYDGMHTFFHAGVLSDSVASCLIELCREGKFGPMPLEFQLVRASREFATYAHNQRLFIDSGHRPKRFTRRKLGFAKNTDAPSLSDTYKCSHCRQFTYWLHEVTSNSHPAHSEYSQTRALLFASFCKFQEVCKKSWVVLTPEERDEAYKHGVKFLDAYFYLWSTNAAARCKFYRCRPKTHCADHIVSELIHGFINPRADECWLDEDLMRVVRDVYSGTHADNTMAAGMKRMTVRLLQQWFDE